MAESMNISLEENESTSTPVLPKIEPNDEVVLDVDAKPNISRLSSIHRGSKADKDAESDFDPNQVSDQEDISIPEESENPSFVSDSKYKGKKKMGKGSKRASYSRQTTPRARPHQYDSEDSFSYFADMPRQRLSRACKRVPKGIMDIDIPSSSSPEEFDETIHVITKERRLQMEAKRIMEQQSSKMSLRTTPVKIEVKAENTDDVEMGSPSKKPKVEPLDTSFDEVEHKEKN